ncbi:protein mono-ADP-ribosyltransferase PARP10 [Cyclopterus lumpus]|uniref:protein mono-ADP-ribosyltransferase PARP10 n=1 Tax=Cyclopterus lumpus TaxID=8103 RepID=UPI0014871C1B|nr:protein mono-ADP-ribosyltransferase PARP10 [Cyclopterus lumpus]
MTSAPTSSTTRKSSGLWFNLFARNDFTSKCFRMPVESPESRTVEVLALPAAVDEELLFLYFENKRRSGGGPLVSVEKNGDRAVLVFEEAEAAAKVLSKGHHVLHNVELSVRRPASKDQCTLLLRGINPNTSTEMIELYVENLMGLNMPDYTLYPSPGRDFILVTLSQPLSKDFQNLSAKISKRKLDGAEISLERAEPTDSVLVENLHPGTTPDLLTLYFESKRGGNQKVKVVTMLSDRTAKVSFVNYESVGPILGHPHKLDGADLVVRPHFDSLLPTERLMSQDSGIGSRNMTERNSEDIQMQTSPPMAVLADSQSSSQTASKPLAVHEAAVEEEEEAAEEEVMEEQTEQESTISSQIPVADPVKLALFQLGTFRQDTENAHPNLTIQIKDNEVHIAGTDGQQVEQIKHAIADFFGKMAEARFTLESEKAQLLARKDVKDRLLQTVTQTGSPAMYTVSDCNVAVTSLSQDSANQACSFLKSQLCHLSIAVDSKNECMLYCREWSEFLQALGFTTVKVSEQGWNIDVFTLKGMEGEKQAAIVQFLTTPIERETVISMQPGILKYIQIHCHQLLADMDQVSIFPLEAEGACGLKIHGPATACQMAEEVLQGVVSSICTRTITVNAPGVTRFLNETECVKIMKEMETKFTVFIGRKYVPWEYLPHQDFFVAAWDLMSHKNFQKVSSEGSPQELKSDSMQTDSDQPDDMDDLDLYSAEEPTIVDQDSSVMVVDDSTMVQTTSGLLRLTDGMLCLPPILEKDPQLEEDAQLSLAIQNSMESSFWSLEDEEQQLQDALALSKKMSQHEASSSSDESPRVVKGNDVCLEDAIKAANTLKLFVFAGYNCDLIRVDIAFGKKVSQRQVEEKLEHRTVKNMSEYHRACLQMIKRKHGVEIQIKGTIITVSGFKDYVTGGLCDVKLLLERISSSVSDREILRTVQWMFHDPDSSDATLYSPDATVFIENALRMRLEKVDILLDNQPHIINFEKMQEYNIASGKSVKVSRKLPELGDLDADVPEEEYSLLSHMPEATKVDEESDEFQKVVKNFYESIQHFHSKIRIIQVEKLMNRLLFNQYKLKKASVLQRATYPEVERTLYHGTSETCVKEICVHGFNRSFSGKNATVYGQGVYFAVNSALSVQEQYSPPNADGYKYIFVSKVLTGDYTKGCHSMKTAPLRETDGIPLRYDSVTDDITKPTMFVIFNDTQAFPEYLITCQKIHR